MTERYPILKCQQHAHKKDIQFITFYNFPKTKMLFFLLLFVKEIINTKQNSSDNINSNLLYDESKFLKILMILFF